MTVYALIAPIALLQINAKSKSNNYRFEWLHFTKSCSCFNPSEWFMHLLNDDEMKTVIADELSHVQLYTQLKQLRIYALPWTFLIPMEGYSLKYLRRREIKTLHGL